MDQGLFRCKLQTSNWLLPMPQRLVWRILISATSMIIFRLHTLLNLFFNKFLNKISWTFKNNKNLKLLCTYILSQVLSNLLWLFMRLTVIRHYRKGLNNHPNSTIGFSFVKSNTEIILTWRNLLSKLELPIFLTQPKKFSESLMFGVKRKFWEKTLRFKNKR